MKNKFIYSIAIVLIAISNLAIGQASIRDSVVFSPLLDFSYAVQFPGGDMQDRFGINSSLSSTFFIKNRKNWLYGVGGSFMFGNNVKEDDFLETLSDENGLIPGISGLYSDVILLERGFTLEAKVGKIFPWFGPNENSGLMIYASAGYLQHKIRIEERNGEVPLLLNDYGKGYDRLSGGFMTGQFIGYRHLGNKRLLNFFVGFEMKQGFTKNLRGYNYDTKQEDNESRVDLLYGFRFGLTLPFYKRPPKEFYYN